MGEGEGQEFQATRLATPKRRRIMATRQAVEVTEPEVIDIPLIENAIVVTGGEEMQKEKKSLRFEEVEWIQLSFKNIVRIENLVGLAKLTKLQLDNNHIKTIENLEHLTNLTWLDLSFNTIETIEGLASLTKITDLCLTHNRIGSLGEGLDTLLNLEILSVANNDITNTDELIGLRKFPVLRVVNFQNNPIAQDPEYQSVILAFLKHLKYLDFRLVDSAKVELAKEQYFSDLQQLQQEEQEQAKLDKQKKDEEDIALRHHQANMPGVANLLKNMIKEDLEGEKLTLFSEFEDPLEDFKDEFQDSWVKYEADMLELHELKESEKSKFFSMYYTAIEGVDQTSKAMVT